MKTSLLMLATIMWSAFAGNAVAMTKPEYTTQKDRISTEYKANRDKCGAMKANAKDICVVEAKGTEKVAKAEMESQYRPSAKTTRDLTLAKADLTYQVAKEKCDDLAGNAKGACVKDAKAAFAKVRASAKVAVSRDPAMPE